jgi:tRNA-dihydrouridine synthase A
MIFMQAQRFSIAPMLDWTDRHCRYFHRLMTLPDPALYRDGDHGAIIHGKGDYLGYSEQEHPRPQLGGSNRQTWAPLRQARRGARL